MNGSLEVNSIVLKDENLKFCIQHVIFLNIEYIKNLLDTKLKI